MYHSQIEYNIQKLIDSKKFTDEQIELVRNSGVFGNIREQRKKDMEKSLNQFQKIKNWFAKMDFSIYIKYTIEKNFYNRIQKIINKKGEKNNGKN